MQIRILVAAAALAVCGLTTAQENAGPSNPYTLDSCPISGKKLGSMGDPVVKEVSGREVRFCCGGCVKSFEKNAADEFKKVDAKLATEQRRYYPLSECAVSGEALDPKNAGEAFVGNRLVLLCCDQCEDELKEKPTEVLARLDAAAVQAQSEAYPLSDCLVSGKKLGAMGKPHEVVLGGRLLKLCCQGCVPKIMKSPAKYLAVVDAAWEKVGFPGAFQARGHDGHDKDTKKHDGHEGHDHKGKEHDHSGHGKH